MSWGLIVNDMFLPRVCVDDLEDRLKETNEFIKHIREKLLILAATSPRDINEDGHFKLWEDHVHIEINTLLDELEDVVYRRSLMLHAIENPSSTTEY